VAEKKKVKFEALIKKLEIKALVSLDKGARVLLSFQPTDDLINDLNRIMKADETVLVEIMND